MSLRWKYREYNWGETATFESGGFKVFAQDCDGDASLWYLKYHDKLIASEDYISEADHFAVAMERAEKALWEECKRQQQEALAALASPPPSPVKDETAGSTSISK